MEETSLAPTPRDLTNEEKMQKFALFITLSEQEKMEEFGFKRQKEFSDTYDITEKTLSLWKNHNEKFKKYRRELLIATRVEDRLPGILNRIIERAEDDGDVNAAKEIFKMAGLTKDQVEIISDTRIKEILSAVVIIIQEEVKDPIVINNIARRFRSEIHV